jgi:predicted nucleic acid-binding protein
VILYLDTSALVTLYVEESGTPRVTARVEQASAVTTARVTYAEARAALARYRREGALSPAGLRQAVRQLDEDWLAYTIVDVGDSVVREAGALAERHALRGYDAVQLAAAVAVRRSGGDVEFATFDARLAAAARRERLQIQGT